MQRNQLYIVWFVGCYYQLWNNQMVYKTVQMTWSVGITSEDIKTEGWANWMTINYC